MKPESVRLKSIMWMGTIAMLAFGHHAQASVACSFSSNPGFALAYVPSHPGQTIISTTFVVQCIDTNGPGGVTVTYSVAANNGLNFSGTQNRGAMGGSFINYSVAQDGACAAPWKGTTYFSASFVIARNTTVTNTYTYYGCVPAGQNPPTGTYTDTVTTSFAVGTVSQAGGTFTPGTFPVSIYTPATCSITTGPGNITFNYTSLSAAPVFASTTFATTCTNLLPYTMALDATSGTIVGVNYTLALSTASATGTGLAQTYSINGTVAAGQVGTCVTATCSGSQTRTLTITY